MKNLITASTVTTAAKNGHKSVSFSAQESIITPEARTVAKELGIELVEQNGADGVSMYMAPSACSQDLDKIRAAVLAQLGGKQVSEELLNQLICKVTNEGKLSNCQDEGAGTHQAIFTTAQGIKRIKGAQVPMGIMEEAGREKQIGLVDILGASDSNSPMAAGYMGWKNCFFPWTLNYDEVDVVLEGELHIRCGGETSIAKVGDVIYIPKGSSIEFGTPTNVRFVFVTYPANWQQTA